MDFYFFLVLNFGCLRVNTLVPQEKNVCLGEQPTVHSWVTKQGEAMLLWLLALVTGDR